MFHTFIYSTNMSRDELRLIPVFVSIRKFVPATAATVYKRGIPNSLRDVIDRLPRSVTIMGVCSLMT